MYMAQYGNAVHTLGRAHVGRYGDGADDIPMLLGSGGLGSRGIQSRSNMFYVGSYGGTADARHHPSPESPELY